MATYMLIQQWIKEHYGFNVKTCWIADVKSQYGLTTRKAPNRIDENQRVHPCPDNKKKPIIAALKHFGMIEQTIKN